MRALEGKAALVTGASRGIGRGVALCLAAEGADVTVNYFRHGEEAAAVVRAVKAMGRRSIAWQADVADRDGVQAMIAGTVSELGSLDIVVANAGFSIREPVIEAEWTHVKRVLEVNQFGVFHTCQLAARQMVRQVEAGRPGGKIIIISSVLEEIPAPGSGAYNMAKAAVNHLGRTMAAELAPWRINVNLVNPGLIDTPGERQYATEEELQARARQIPWRRLGTPEDIGQVVAFLASEGADYITGATVRVDGGLILGLQLPEGQEW
jgi:glucose 1-dehydrogenase